MTYDRQTSLYDPAQDHQPNVTLIGAGAIGSWTGVGLAKLGIKNVTIHDPDRVEAHNLPNQAFEPPALEAGSNKAGALMRLMLFNTTYHRVGTTERLSDYVNYTARANKFENQRLTELVICAVDNMETRKAVYDRVQDNVNVKLFIDPRMGGGFWRIYAIDPSRESDLKLYDENWYPDSEAAQENCTQRSIVYTAMGCASDVVSLVRSYAKDLDYPAEVLGSSSGFRKQANHWTDKARQRQGSGVL